MAKSFLNIHFYAKNIKKIFKNGVKCKKSGNFGLLNQEFGFSKVYYIYSFYFIKNRSAEKSLLNRESLLYLRLLNQESTVVGQHCHLWHRLAMKIKIKDVQFPAYEVHQNSCLLLEVRKWR